MLGVYYTQCQMLIGDTNLLWLAKGCFQPTVGGNKYCPEHLERIAQWQETTHG